MASSEDREMKQQIRRAFIINYILVCILHLISHILKLIHKKEQEKKGFSGIDLKEYRG